MVKVKVTREQKKLLKAIKKNPHDSASHARLGWSYFEQRKHNEASQYFTQAIELRSDPDAVADAMYGLALLDFENGKYEQAKDGLRSLIREYPNFSKRPEVHFSLAQANDLLWRQTEWKNETEREHSEYLQRAIDHYEQALERRSAQHHTANFLLGKLFYDAHRSEDAFSCLQRASTSNALERKDEIEANYLLGKLSLHVKQDLGKAREYFEAALKKGATQDMLAELHHQLGNISRTEEDDEQAVRQYERALSYYGAEQSEDVFDLLVNLSELKHQHHWQQAAIDSAERAMQIPTESTALRRRLLEILAESYDGINQYEKAVEYEQQYFELTKDAQGKAESLLRLGMMYEHLKQDKKATDVYRRGLKFAKRNLDSSKLNAALGHIYLRENRLNQAMKHLKEALGFAQENDEHAAFVYRLLGAAYIKRQKTEKAIETYGVILAKYPESKEEPAAREELKNFRKQFKKELKDIEHAQASEDFEQPMKAGDDEELERLLELVEEILDEKGFFERLKEGLAKTHLGFVSKIEQLLTGRTNVDDELIEDLEEALILSDIGVATTQRIIEHLEESVARKELQDPAQIKHYLKREIQELLQGSEKRLEPEREKPFVILVIGVNGTGKTTTIGKMASKFRAQGKDVLLVAGDTFRAAAIEQLEIWGERSGCEIIKHASGADPSAVMYDAIHAAASRNVDVVIADTAGRLHTKKNLMEELKKMVRIIAREMPGAPHEILLVIDATTGQNAVSQAKLFNEGVGITGLILTKLDGTAKGGIIVGIANDLKIPVTYIGIGEQVEDLREFHAKEFVEALFED